MTTKTTSDSFPTDPDSRITTWKEILSWRRTGLRNWRVSSWDCMTRWRAMRLALASNASGNKPSRSTQSNYSQENPTMSYTPTPKTRFSLGDGVALSLAEAARQYGASDRELEAILRLQNGEGTARDVYRLERLAGLADMSMPELFPGLYDR